MRSALLVAAAVALSSCTMAQVVPEALNTEFKPTGEIQMYDRSSGFDAVRVRSPKVNLSKRTDGSWAGTLGDRPLDVTVYGNRVSGVEFTMTKEASEGGRLVITGQFQGRIYRFELDEKQAMFRMPNNSFTLPNRQVGPNQTVYGPQGNLVLRGEAGSDSPPWPQIGFALIALSQ